MLEVLEIECYDSEPDDLAAWDGIPDLRILRLKGTPNLAEIKFFAMSLPSQAKVQLDLWDQIRIPFANRLLIRHGNRLQCLNPSFPKINCWTFSHVGNVIAVIDRFPCFAPETLEMGADVDDVQDEIHMTAEDWSKLVRLESLQRLTVMQLDSHLLLWGLPKNLDEILHWLTRDNSGK